MSKVIKVTPAQVNAAKRIVKRSAVTGEVVPPGVRKIAQAKRNEGRRPPSDKHDQPVDPFTRAINQALEKQQALFPAKDHLDWVTGPFMYIDGHLVDPANPAPFNDLSQIWLRADATVDETHHSELIETLKESLKGSSARIIGRPGVVDQVTQDGPAETTHRHEDG